MSSMEGITDVKICVICSQTVDEKDVASPGTLDSWVRLKEAAKICQIEGVLLFRDNFSLAWYHKNCRKKICNKKFQCSQKNTENRVVESGPVKCRNRREVSSSDVLPKRCIYCDSDNKYAKNSRTRETLHTVETLESQKFIVTAAKNHIESLSKWSRDASRILGICSKDLVASEAKYHSSCRRDFMLSTKGISKSVCAREDEYDLIEELGFNSVIDFCHKLEFEPKVVELESVRNIMSQEYESNGMEWKENDRKNFIRKLTTKCPSINCVHVSRNRKLLYPNTLSVESLVLENNSLKTELENLRNATKRDQVLIMSGEIIQQDIRSLSVKMSWPPEDEDLTMESVVHYIPCSLNTFLSTLFEYPKSSQIEQRSEVRKLAIAQDIVFSVSRGKVKTPKSILLTSLVKSLTNNTECIRVLNKLGHGIDYHAMEELETLEALKVIDVKTENKVAIPPKIMQTRRSCSSVALVVSDNIDNLERTLSGANTSHRVNSIIVLSENTDQQSCDDSNMAQGTLSVYSPSPPKRKKIRSIPEKYLQQPNFPLCFNRKQGPEEMKFINEATTIPYERVSQSQRIRYIIWVASRHLASRPDLLAPNWTGFNILVRDNVLVVQSKIAYLDALDAPATEHTTAFEILQRALAIKDSLELDGIVAVFDQALYAKCAEMKWQHLKEFESIVIMMGGFHLLQVLFNVIGIRFGDAGIRDLAILSKVVAQGSIESVVSGKNYNRAVRFYKVLYDALMRLLMDQFHSTMTEEQEELVVQLQREVDKLKENICAESFEECLHSSTLEEWNLLFNRFVSEETSDLFKFWLTFLDLFELCLNLIYSTRTGDWLKYISCIEACIPWIFAYDRQNYAKYMVPYLNDMKSLPQLYPAVYKAFLEGSFSVQMSESNGFSRNEADKTIENTINKDCKGPGGFTGFSVNFCSTQKWILNSGRRALYKRLLHEILTSKHSTHKHNDLFLGRMKRDENDVISIYHILGTSCYTNPWLGGDLRSLSSGLVATPQVREDIMNAHEKGFAAYQNFISDRCLNNHPKQFFDPLPKLKLKTFSSMKKVFTTKLKNKTVALTSHVSLFTRLAFIAQDRKIDMRNVLTYPLGPLPWALSDANGYPRTTDKSQLIKVLEKNVPSQSVYPVCFASVFDGMYLLRKVNIPSGVTFGKVAEIILNRLLICPSSRIHVVFDEYRENSIKTFQRIKRRQGTCEEALFSDIKWEFQVRSWSNFLSIEYNKASITVFLREAWQSPSLRGLLQEKELFVSIEGKCIRITRDETTEVLELTCDHEEADTAMILHTYFLSQRNFSHIVINAHDTDVLILLLSCCTKIVAQLYMRMGQGKNERLVKLSDIYGRIAKDLPENINSEDFCSALLGFHSFTGCDTISSFYRKGKREPLKILKQSSLYVSAFKDLGQFWTVSEGLFDILESFLCEMYGKRLTDVNTLRYQLYTAKFSFSSIDKNLVEPELLPPCQSTFRLHVQRANYQAAVWRRAMDQKICAPSPEGHGWEQDADGCICVKWLQTRPAPEEVLEFVNCKCSFCSNDACSCAQSNQTCTELCKCRCSKEIVHPESEDHIEPDKDVYSDDSDEYLDL